MIILGISDSHDSHACVIINGEVVAAIAEERLRREKAYIGYPKLAIEAVLKIASVTIEEVDHIAVAGEKTILFHNIYKYDCRFSMQDFVRQCHDYWRPKLYEGRPLTPLDDFNMFRNVGGIPVEDDAYYPFIERIQGVPESDWADIGQEIRLETIQKHLSVPRGKIGFYRHEACHQIYGLYSSPRRIEDALIVTAESFGDDSAATVATVENGREIVEKQRTKHLQLGRVYRYMTLFLGMRPVQHEYKVMGLAPYGSKEYGARSLKAFERINQVEDIEIKFERAYQDFYFDLGAALEGERFDNIAWGLQRWTENILCEWIGNCALHHNKSHILFSGGVAQNIKACLALSKLPNVASIWSGPVSGDGSLAIGAGWLAHARLTKGSSIKNLETAYLGSEYNAQDINLAIEKHKTGEQFNIINDPSPERVARWLANGKIGARFSGRMEFGHRALGNRSIIADPRRHESVNRINFKIKSRDFWMPFTPSILHEDNERYLENPKNLFSPYMTMAFDTKKECDETPAVVHPADKTIRPQMLKQQANPDYHKIISAFKQETGHGMILNTSFNLHGEAIVESPSDALNTMERSDLDFILFDHLAVSRISD